MRLNRCPVLELLGRVCHIWVVKLGLVDCLIKINLIRRWGNAGPDVASRCNIKILVTRQRCVGVISKSIEIKIEIKTKLKDWKEIIKEIMLYVFLKSLLLVCYAIHKNVRARSREKLSRLCKFCACHTSHFTHCVEISIRNRSSLGKFDSILLKCQV